MINESTLQIINTDDKFTSNSSLKFLEWMDSTEASNYLRVSVGSLRNMVSQGQIRTYKLGKRLRFKRIELDKAMKLFVTGDSSC